MADYQLYCFAQSGNAYRAPLMLNQDIKRTSCPVTLI